MVLPEAPLVLAGTQAIGGVADAARWTAAKVSQQRIMRAQEGLIAVPDKADPGREGSPGDTFVARR